MTARCIARCIPLCLIALLATPLTGTAVAQSSTPGPKVHEGQTIWIVGTDGFELKGIVSEISATAIDVSGEFGTKRLKLSDIRRIEKKDSNWTGFWIGTGVTALAAGFAGAVYHSEGYNYGTTGSRQSATGEVIGFMVVGSALYGGIGALIDNAIQGRQTVWENKGSATLSMTPILARKSVGLGASIMWK